jgi:hypothetical protein
MDKSELKLSRSEFKKIIQKMPENRCIICSRKPYVLGIFTPSGPSEFAKINQNIRVPHCLCFECFLDANRSAQKVDEIITRALSDCQTTA